MGGGLDWPMSGAGGGNGSFTADDRGTSLDFCSWHFHSTGEMPFESIDMWNECFTIQTPQLLMPCTIPCQTPKGHLNSMRGLVGPNPHHVKDCDNICWHLTTIFAGPGASMFAAKFVDNICQSASQVFASLAHPSAADNHTLSDLPRHGPIHGPEHPTDQYALCCRSKLFLCANFKYLLPLKKKLCVNFNYLLPPKTICV